MPLLSDILNISILPFLAVSIFTLLFHSAVFLIFSSNSVPSRSLSLSLSQFPLLWSFFFGHSFGILGTKDFSIFWPTPSPFYTGNSEEGIDMFTTKDFGPLWCNASSRYARFRTFRKRYYFIRFFIIILVWYARSHSSADEALDRPERYAMTAGK